MIFLFGPLDQKGYFGYIVFGMNKLTLFIALVFGAFMVSGPAEASGIKRKHKPWFASTATVTKPVVKRAAIVKSPRVVSRPISRSVARKGDKGDLIAKQAAAYKGTRYQFGGTSEKGLDCSGLVSRVWKDLQMNKIPRASAALYQKGEPVNLSQLRPGDLVFFKNTYKRGISHVGVYAGKNRFIHASPKRGVTTAKLSEPYYQLRYAGARRLY